MKTLTMQISKEAKVVLPGIRGRERIEEKAKRYTDKFPGDDMYRRVRDYVRFAIVGKTAASLVNACDRISRSAHIVLLRIGSPSPL